LLRLWRRRLAALAALTFLAACTASFPARASQQSPWTVETVLRQLDNEAKNFRSLTADIEYTKVTVVVDDHSTETGQIFVRRDDKMRIEFAQPDPRTILRDGANLYLFNPKIQRVEEYDLGKNKAMVDQFLLLGFGTSGASLRKNYVIIMQDEETLDNRKVILLELTPKNDDVQKQVSKIQIWLDESTWLPAQQKFFETGSGDYLNIRYTKVASNIRLSDTRFKPDWPKSVTRVKPQD
jgi:outer membrane lipoprotein-sorting protein